MRKNPGFTAIAVLSLGFGIAATTTIFSVIDAVDLRPLRIATKTDRSGSAKPRLSTTRRAAGALVRSRCQRLAVRRASIQ